MYRINKIVFLSILILNYTIPLFSGICRGDIKQVCKDENGCLYTFDDGSLILDYTGIGLLTEWDENNDNFISLPQIFCMRYFLDTDGSESISIVFNIDSKYEKKMDVNENNFFWSENEIISVKIDNFYSQLEDNKSYTYLVPYNREKHKKLDFNFFGIFTTLQVSWIEFEIDDNKIDKLYKKILYFKNNTNQVLKDFKNR